MKLSIFLLTFVAIAIIVNAEVTQSQPTQLTFPFHRGSDHALRTQSPPKRFRRSPDTKVSGGINIGKSQPTWNAAIGQTLYNKNDRKVDIVASTGGDFRHQPPVNVNLGASFPKTNVNAGVNIVNGKPNSWNAAVDRTLLENKHGKISVQAGVGGPIGHKPEAQAAIVGTLNIPG